tara:strand:+ start:1194 stop:2369 length:1176 start_codon:yes stop_codon:yes gene_type:complete
MDINHTISKLYNDAGFMQKYGGEFWLAGLIIFIFGVAITYVNVLNHMHSIKKNWSHERCNPFIIPLAGWINNTNKKTESNYKYTVDNFEFCLSNYIKSSFSFIVDAFKYMLQGVYDIFKDLLLIISDIINYIMSIIKSIFEALENAWGLALQATAGMQQVLNKAEDSFNRIIGFFVTVLYVKIMLFRMSILWLITTPVFMLFTVLINVFVDILLVCIAYQIKVTAMWAAYLLCGTYVISRCSSMTMAFFESLASAAGWAVSGAMGLAGAIMAGIGISLSASIVTAPAGAADEGAATGMLISSAAAAGAAAAAAAAAVAQTAYGVIQANAYTLGCILVVVRKILQIIMILATFVQFTACTVILYLMFTCMHFVKVTLGQMNIPGQGIPGLSF